MTKIVNHDERRELFSAAAFRLISKKGYEKVTTIDVAHEAGFTTGALFHYVKTKEDLLIEAGRYWHRLTAKRVAKIQKEMRGLEIIRHVLIDVLPRDSSTPWNIGLPLYERAQRNPKVFAMLEEQVQDWQKWIIAVLQQSQADGEIPADLNLPEVAKIMYLFVQGLSLHYVKTKRSQGLSDIRGAIEAWIKITLQPIPKRKSRNPGRRSRVGALELRTARRSAAR
jgi:AcrR family transcriptional regulator